MTLQTKRIYWLDTARAMAIFLVVLGHALRGGMVQHVLYSFHVPAFFLLSGMTCKTDRLRQRIKQDVLRIMVPYYFFGILSILIFWALGQVAASRLGVTADSSLGVNLRDLLYASADYGRMKFNMPLWFLPCLFVVKLLYYGLDRLCRGNRKRILALSSLLAALAFLYAWLDGPATPFSFSLALKMVAYFALGRVFMDWLGKQEGKFQQGLPALLVGAALILVTIPVACLSHRIEYTCDSFGNVFAFLTTSLCGGFGLCFLAMGLGTSRLPEYVGKNTLPILLMHKFPLLLLQMVGPLAEPMTKNTTLTGILAATAASLISMGLCLIAGWVIRKWFPFLMGDFTHFFQKEVSR